MNHARRSRLANSLAAGLLLCAVLTSLAASAEPVLDSVPTLENIAKRLELTTEQQAQLKPIFSRRLSEVQQTQLQLQQASTPQQKDSVLREAKKASDAFNSQVESVLSPSQRNEWHEIRSETREKITERAE
jgi:Skp family chaperone for outer membrane proteins